MDVGDLKEYLNKFPDNTPIVILNGVGIGEELQEKDIIHTTLSYNGVWNDRDEGSITEKCLVISADW